VIPAKPNIKGFENVHKTDVPTIFQLPGAKKWYMIFIGFDGMGYQSFVAESDDLLHWTNMQLAMGFGNFICSNDFSRFLRLLTTKVVTTISALTYFDIRTTFDFLMNRCVTIIVIDFI